MEYYIDVTDMPIDMQSWMVMQGAEVWATDKYNYDRQGRSEQVMEVYFSGRKIHFYAGNKMARIFFNDETKGTALLLMVKWPEKVFKTNLDRQANTI